MTIPTLPQAARQAVRRRPVTAFLLITFLTGYPPVVLALLAGVDPMPAKLLGLLGMLGGAVLVTAWTSGRTGVRGLFAGLTRWRIGLPRYLLVLGAMPLLTVAVAAGTGTLRTPADGWGGVAGTYAVILLFSALTANLWEETAWAGFLQNRLMSARGLLTGSLLTAVPFFLLHLPLAFENHGLRGTRLTDAVVDWVAIAALAPCLRYLVGVLTTTTGSTLAAALLHASFNASGALPVIPQGWQMIPALALLALAVAVSRRRAGHGTRRTGTAEATAEATARVAA